MKIRYILTTIVISVVMMFAVTACGGGGSSDGATSSHGGAESGEVDNAAPTDIESSIDYQYLKVAEMISILTDLREGENTALEALNDQRYEDWDEFWLNEYPLLVERMQKNSEELGESEDYIKKFVFEPSIAFRKRRKEISNAGFVVIPFAIYMIYTVMTADEKRRAAELKKPPTESEIDKAQKLRAKQIRRLKAEGRMKIADSQIEFRAHADIIAPTTGKAFVFGTEHATEFVTDQGLGGSIGYISRPAKGAFILYRNKGKIFKAISSSKGCNVEQNKKKNILSLIDTKAEQVSVSDIASSLPSTCQIHVCSTENGVCSNLPEGEWETTIFLPGYLRDVDSDVIISEGSITEVDVDPMSIEDIENGDTGGGTDSLVYRTDARLNTVWAWSDSGAIAAGEYDSAAKGYKISKYNGSSWSESLVSIPDYGSIMDIWGTSENNIYAVTEGTVWHDSWSYFDGGKILHYNGTSWSVVSGKFFDDGQSYRSIWGTSPSNIYATGINGISYPYIYHFNGSEWSYDRMENIVGVNDTIMDIHGNTIGNIYAISDNFENYSSSSVLKLSTSEWVDALNNDTFPLRNYHLNGVWVSPDNHVFLALDGRSDSPIVHYNPTNDSWNADIDVSVISNIHSLESIWGSSSSDVYAVGTKYVNAEKNKVGAVILHYDGTLWTEVLLPEDVDILALNGVSGVGKTFIVGIQNGSGGVILQK